METFEMRGTVIFAMQGILDWQKMIKSVGPKTRFKIGAGQKSKQSIAINCLMSVFHWTVLMRRIRTNGTNIVPEFFEKGTDLWVVKKFTTLVQVNVLVLELR